MNIKLASIVICAMGIGMMGCSSDSGSHQENTSECKEGEDCSSGNPDEKPAGKPDEKPSGNPDGKNDDKCDGSCMEGTYDCSEYGVMKCVKEGDDCPAMIIDRECEGGTKCNAETHECDDSCHPECDEGDTKCTDKGFISCHADSTGCLRWGEETACEAGTHCVDGECVESCEDECISGQTECKDNSVRTCGNYDNDSCLEWSEAAACPTGEVCNSEGVACENPCASSCTIGDIKCDGDDVVECIEDTKNHCPSWGNRTVCEMGKSCDPATHECTFACGDDCDPFSIVLVPDTQYYTRLKGCTAMAEKDSKNLPQMKALAGKKKDWNIKYVIHLGDMTQKNIVKDLSGRSQWEIASKSMKYLDDADIPNSPATGNHDYKQTNESSKDSCAGDDNFTSHGNSHFKEYFNEKRYAGKTWAPKVFKSSTESMYGTFNIGRIKFLVITLEFAARKETLCEADRIISEHPDHHVIIEMHNYMNKKGQLSGHNYYDVLFGAGGKEVSKELTERHGNVFLVVAGHVSGSFYREDVRGSNQNRIREMLVDYQSETPEHCEKGGGYDLNNAGNGWVRRIVVNPKTGEMTATTESLLGFKKLFCSRDNNSTLNPENVDYYPADPTKTIKNNDGSYTGHRPVMTGMDFAKTPVDNYTINDYGFTTRAIGTGGRHQMNGAIAMNRNTGDFVTVWEDDDSKDDGDGNYDIRARISCVGGCNKSGFFYVNNVTKGNQVQPDAAMDLDGNFVVVWADDSDGDGKYDIYMRGYKPDGTERFGSKIVNTVDKDQQRYPKIAMADDGNFVVVWEDTSAGYEQIYMRGFNADGSERFAQQLAVGGSSGTYRYPDVAMSADGHFVVVWEDDSDGNGITQVLGKGFNSDGSVQLNGFVINTVASHDQIRPAVAMNSRGDYAIAWLDDRGSKGIFMTYARGFKAGTSDELIEERSFSPDGKNTKHPDIAMTEDGSISVVWEIVGGIPNKNADYCKYKNTKTAECNDIQRASYKNNNWGAPATVNNNPYSGHSAPAIASDGKGRNVILWNDDSDGNGAYDVYMRGFNNI